MKKLTKEQKLKKRVKDLEYEINKVSRDNDDLREFENEIKAMFDKDSAWDRNMNETLLSKVSKYYRDAESFRRANEGTIKAGYEKAETLQGIIEAMIRPEILDKKYDNLRNIQ
jgi:uncharacterized protein YlxW (UPF0749 family)